MGERNTSNIYEKLTFKLFKYSGINTIFSMMVKN